MASLIFDDVLDGALDEIAKCDRIFFVSGTVGVGVSGQVEYDLANRTADKNLATDTVTVGDGNGNYVIGGGDTSGRKLTVTPNTGITVNAGGDITHVALGIAGSLDILYEKELTTSVTCTTANTLDPIAFDIEFADPTDA